MLASSSGGWRNREEAKRRARFLPVSAGFCFDFSKRGDEIDAMTGWSYYLLLMIGFNDDLAPHRHPKSAYDSDISIHNFSYNLEKLVLLLPFVHFSWHL